MGSPRRWKECPDGECRCIGVVGAREDELGLWQKLSGAAQVAATPVPPVIRWRDDRACLSFEANGCSVRFSALRAPVLGPMPLTELRHQLSEWAERDGQRVLDIHHYGVDGLQGVEITRKGFMVPRTRKGRRYEMGLYIPTADGVLAYVVSAGQQRPGRTREAAIAGEMVAAGHVTRDAVTGALQGWLLEGADQTDPLAPNLSELELFDKRFPEHPLSRVRKTFRKVLTRVHVSDEARRHAEHWVDSQRAATAV